MDPVEDGDLAEVGPVGSRPPDRLDDEGGLVALVARRDDANELAVGSFAVHSSFGSRSLDREMTPRAAETMRPLER